MLLLPHPPDGVHPAGHAPFVARCPRCHGLSLGPVSPPKPVRLATGERVLVEAWGCLDCVEGD